jgi:hypothetical protein
VAHTANAPNRAHQRWVFFNVGMTRIRPLSG